jgi:hypothetical protein
VVVLVGNDVVPDIAACEAHQQPGKILVVTPKRLLQHNLPKGDFTKSAAYGAKPTFWLDDEIG